MPGDDTVLTLTLKTQADIPIEKGQLKGSH